MTSRRRFLALLGGGAALAGAATAVRLAAGGGAVSAFPEIDYGAEQCSHCTMPIDDARFAAAWRRGREERHFDDIGCMVSAYYRAGADATAHCFVHDYHSQSWLDATMATYVLSPAIKTPMAYGVFAMADGAGAAAHAGHDALRHDSWNELLASLERKG
jgi:hypothetical protein